MYNYLITCILVIALFQDTTAQQAPDSSRYQSTFQVNLLGPLSYRQPFLEFRYSPAAQWDQYRLDVSARVHTSFKRQYRNEEKELIGETKNPFALGTTVGLNRIIGTNGWNIRLEGMYLFINSDNNNWLQHRTYQTNRLYEYSRRIHQVGLLVGAEWRHLDRNPLQQGKLSLKWTIGAARVFNTGDAFLPHHEYTYNRFNGRSQYFYNPLNIDRKWKFLSSLALFYDLNR